MISILPPLSKFLKNELITLHFLRTSQTVGLYFPQLGSDANDTYFRCKNTRGGFGFASYVDVIHHSRRRRVFLGGTIDGNGSGYANISYSLLVAKSCDPCDGVLRKFHFDATFPKLKRKQAQPAFHLQYCGKLGSYLQGQGFANSHIECLLPGISEPRIPHAPMSLAMLLDLVLHEFPKGNSQRLRDQSAWREILRDNERLLLQPFHKKCLDILSRQTGQLWAEEFYV